jgi:hypothetical protein
MAASHAEQTEFARYLRWVRVFLTGAAGLFLFAVLLASIERPSASIGFYSLGTILGILLICVVLRKSRRFHLPQAAGKRNRTAEYSKQADALALARHESGIGNEDPLLLDCLSVLQRLQDTRALIRSMRTSLEEASGHAEFASTGTSSPKAP